MATRKKPAKNDLVTLSQAADLYGYSGDYLRRLAEKGRLNAQKIGHHWLTTTEDVESFLVTREKRGVYKKRVKMP
jgi:excisionase family DNA binding protein